MKHKQELRTGADDGHARAVLTLVHARQLHVGGVIRDVHERRVDHLVVHRVLRALAQAARARVEVVDEERRHLVLFYKVARLAIALAHQLRGLARIACLELTRGHDNGLHIHGGEGERDLEGLALALAAPDAEDQRHLDLAERLVHVVLGTVHRQLHAGAAGAYEQLFAIVRAVRGGAQDRCSFRTAGQGNPMLCPSCTS